MKRKGNYGVSRTKRATWWKLNHLYARVTTAIITKNLTKETMITIQTKRKEIPFLRGVCEHVPHNLCLGILEVHTFFFLVCVAEKIKSWRWNQGVMKSCTSESIHYIECETLKQFIWYHGGLDSWLGQQLTKSYVIFILFLLIL